MSTKTSIVRSLRNNNPLNIRLGDAWQGMLSCQTDGAFCQFSNIVYGYRAALTIIRRYISVHHADTIRKIVTRWAPPSENNTESYIRFVSSMSGVPADRTIQLSERDIICEVVAAMQYQETGVALGSDIVRYSWSLFF